MGKTNADLKRILDSVKRIAVVGLSPNPVRPSYYVARYLQLKGYRIVPVNPVHSGTRILGAPVHARLSDIDGPVDMVDIFRKSADVPAIVEEALASFPELKVI